MLNKLQDLQNKFELRREKKEKEIRLFSEELQSYRSEAEKLKEAIEKVRVFLSTETA